MQRASKDGRAKAFAFIFYDFANRDMRRILKDEGVFAQPDRLSGKELSIFFIHSGTRHAVNALNDTFLKQLGVNDSAGPPCTVFFKLSKDKVRDAPHHEGWVLSEPAEGEAQ